MRERLDLSGIRTLVLDEADRMLEMGFVEGVSEIARAIPSDHQTLLFSATFPDAVRTLSTTYQRDALHVVVPAEDVTARITQVLYDVGRLERIPALIRILGHHHPDSAIVFCNHRETCDEVAEALANARYAAVALHGGMEQHDRNTVLLLLKNGSLRVVVATDVAARGLDIDDLGAIINFDLPREPDVFVHRIGRTARAGRSGVAISLARPADGRILDDLRQGPLANVGMSPIPSAEAQQPPAPAMTTIAIQGGRHDRLRPGDIVGALTTGVGIAATDIGQITVNDRISFVAVVASVATRALDGLAAGRIKNKRFRSYLVKPPR
jgi:ATP-independent RNA helicase DbpA